MILLISISEHELTTDFVIDWLHHYKSDYFRLNFDLLESNERFNVTIKMSDQIRNHLIIYDGKNIDLSKVNVIWYRRLFDDSINNAFFRENNFSNQFNIDINEFIIKERVFFNNFLFYCLKDYKWLDFPLKSKEIAMSKLRNLDVAMKIGLTIPNTIITNSLNQISEFKKTYKKIITKPISYFKRFEIELNYFSTFTALVKDIETDFNFIPSLFQQYIEKKYELRIFYLDGEFYTIAIFTSQSNKTKVDSRNYDYSFPNRRVSYNLPKAVENKLDKLMKELQLKNSSIDMIKGIDGNYYFLEVNPVGQFAGMSNACNYNLEEKIALHLIKENITNGESEI